MYKLLTLDIDGTISKEKNIVSDAVVDAVQWLYKKGVPVCICTGRNTANAMPVVKRLGIDTPIVTIDGIVVYCPKEKRILYNNKLDFDIMSDLAEIIGRCPVFVEAVTNDHYHKFVNNAPSYDYGLGRMNPYSRYAETFEDIIQILPEAVEFIVAGDDLHVKNVRELITDKYGSSVGIRDNLWQNYLFIGPPETGKSAGIRQLCEYYNIKISEVVAIGDDLNDLDMLESVGMGVAMGNAVLRAKEVADYVTSTVDEDGAADAIYKFFRKQ